MGVLLQVQRPQESDEMDVAIEMQRVLLPDKLPGDAAASVGARVSTAAVVAPGGGPVYNGAAMFQ